MEHAKHIIRAVLLLVLVAVAFVFVRHFAIPESFGEHGHFRYDSVEEHAAENPVHGTPEMCAECHDEEAEILTEGKHGSVSCEVCHAPLGFHVSGERKVGDMPMQRSYELCLRCHQALAARPKDFPQVAFPDHITAKSAELELTEDVCWECQEDAHDPGQ